MKKIEYLPAQGEMSELVAKVNELVDTVNDLIRAVSSVRYETDPLNRIG